MIPFFLGNMFSRNDCYENTYTRTYGAQMLWYACQPDILKGTISWNSATFDSR